MKELVTEGGSAVGLERVRWLAAVLVVALGAAACGQKPGVHRELARAGSGAGDGLEAAGPGEDVGGGGAEVPGAGPGVPGGTQGGATRTATTRTGPVATSAPGVKVGGPADRTGITDTEITIGVHAPLTGAAPLQSSAFQKGKDLYWLWLHNDLGKTIHGRKVRVVFRDDQYQPQTAVAVCKAMAEQEKAFLLVGGAGTDQIQACAQYAERNGIPYLSPGVTEAGLTGLQRYFAFSMSYKAQGALVAQLVYRKLPAQELDRYSPNGIPQPDGDVKLAFVRPETANFEDAEEGLKAGLAALGKKIEFVAKVPKEDSPNLTSAVTAAISEMKSRGIDVVATVTAPVVTINMVQQAEAQAYLPRFVGPGITNGLNQVSNVLCKGANSAFHKASFFSPWPGWPEVMAGQFDPDFKRAADKYAASDNTISGGGDIILAFWSFSKTIHRMLEAAGRDLSRQSFVAMLDAGFSAETGLGPPVRYGPGKHFGASSAHRLEADCAGDKAFHQKEAFVSGY